MRSIGVLYSSGASKNGFTTLMTDTDGWMGLACIDLVARRSWAFGARNFTARAACSMVRHSVAGSRGRGLVQISDRLWAMLDCWKEVEWQGENDGYPRTRLFACSPATDMTRQRCGDSISHVPLKPATAGLGNLVGRKSKLALIQTEAEM